MNDTGERLTIDEVTDALSAAGLKFQTAGPDVIRLGFGDLDSYRDPDGDARLALVLDLRNERFTIYAPMAWKVPAGENRAAVCETCLRLQWRYFAIRLELDHHDGELRIATNFFPGSLPAASAVTSHISAFVRVIETIHPAISAAIDEGVMFDPDTTDTPAVASLAAKLAELSPEQLEVLLAAVREEVPQ